MIFEIICKTSKNIFFISDFDKRDLSDKKSGCFYKKMQVNLFFDFIR